MSVDTMEAILQLYQLYLDIKSLFSFSPKPIIFSHQDSLSLIGYNATVFFIRLLHFLMVYSFWFKFVDFLQ